jgi:hypothetical protein
MDGMTVDRLPLAPPSGTHLGQRCAHNVRFCLIPLQKGVRRTATLLSQDVDTIRSRPACASLQIQMRSCQATT